MTETTTIRLTPTGALRWQPAENQPKATALTPVFQANWRAGLFTLAAEKVHLENAPTVRYWRNLADYYLTGLCHIPENQKDFAVEAPSAADIAGLLLTAPPMQGGEYLSKNILQYIWDQLAQWVHTAVQASNGLEHFLPAHAPRWHQVGRVCFHLAENKNDDAHPFAFLATYAAGFGATGRLTHIPLRTALEQYSGAKNKAALIKLLAPVQQAAKSCPWVQEMVDNGTLYQPSAWTVERAYDFLRSTATLEQSGLSVRVPNWWKKRTRPRVTVTIGEQKKITLGANALLGFNVAMALGEEPLSPGELAKLLQGEEGLVFVKGQWVEIDHEKLQEAIAHWESLKAQAEQGEISFIEGMRLLAGASPDLKHEEQAEQEHPWVHVEAGNALREMLAGLHDPKQLLALRASKNLKAELRPYQKEGLAWLWFLSELGLGACLADDMGLGKTIQVLALLLHLRQARPHKGPSLLVVPASLLGNWRSETDRFAPALRLVFVHPAETDRKTLEKIAHSPASQLATTDLVVTTYAMLGRQDWLLDLHWQLVILDEAQAIKNPQTRQTKVVKKIAARARIVLTGTPVENRLGDLWSLFDFLNPGLLGSIGVFKKFVKAMQEREHDAFAPMRRLVSPYILRRLKTDRSIIDDLPEKTETQSFCTLTRAQVKLYEKSVRAMEKVLATTDGIKRRGLVLQTLLRLKQICNHPSQLSGDGEYQASHSGKFQRLAEICEVIAERQEKVLIFTQFREIIAPLDAHLTEVFGQAGVSLHGGTPIQQRKTRVNRFQEEDGPPFFVLSLKAGGTGLNLTAASHVIHFDRWWNPAVENQATDRAFRIGQKRNVLVHKFITRGTVEEHIDAMINEKQQLANEILTGNNELTLTELADEELLQLVRLDVHRASL